MAIELVKKNYSQAKVTAMVIDARPARMAGGKSLPRVENERVVSILKKLLPHYDNNQTKLAAAIGIKQPSLSNIISGKTGVGNQALAGLSKLIGVAEYQIRSGAAVLAEDGRALLLNGNELTK